MTTTEVLLPQWGMGMTEGTVVRWLYGIGDRVEEGDDLVEVEAAKATAYVPAPVTGRLLEIRVEPERTVPVYDVLAIMEEE